MMTAERLFNLLPQKLQFESDDYFLNVSAIEPVHGWSWFACYINEKSDKVPGNFYEHGRTPQEAMENLYETIRLIGLLEGKPS